MRKRTICGTVIIDIFTISIIVSIICFRGGISQLGWIDYISIVSMLFLVGSLTKFICDMIYYQKKIMNNYCEIYEKFKELHKFRYRLYFTSKDNEKIEKITKLLNDYVMVLLKLGNEIIQDEEYPQSYRRDAQKIIINTLKLAKQIQS